MLGAAGWFESESINDSGASVGVLPGARGMRDA